uniref:Uncharacterized protein n=1 Tax=Anguilla anguilla TaxID=7936 RepID=A0A0E9TWK0_ANGAN
MGGTTRRTLTPTGQSTNQPQSLCQKHICHRATVPEQ